MLITEIRLVTPHLLTAIFRANQVLNDSESIAKIRKVQSEETADSFTAILALQYKDFRTQRHAPDKIFIKLVKPKTADKGKKEITFYNDIAAPVIKQFGLDKLRIPRCYDAFYDDITGQSHLILEDISSAFRVNRQNGPQTVRHAEQIVQSLAHLHAYWWQHDRLGLLSPLPDELLLDRQLGQYQQKYEEMMQFSSGQINLAQREILKQIVAAFPTTRRRRLLEGKGLTITHQQLHPGNLMYSHRNVILIDWQGWQVRTGTDDLAYMMACYWPEATRAAQEKRLLQIYYNTLLESGVTDYTWEMCWYDYRASVAACITRILSGWSRDKMMSGYWKPGEKALKTFIHLDGMTIYNT